MSGIKYKLKGKVWQYESEVSWFFVNVNEEISKEIKANQIFRRGFGSVPVWVIIGETRWKTSIFPNKNGEYWLPLKLDVRKKENIVAGKEIEFELEVEV